MAKNKIAHGLTTTLCLLALCSHYSTSSASEPARENGAETLATTAIFHVIRDKRGQGSLVPIEVSIDGKMVVASVRGEPFSTSVSPGIHKLRARLDVSAITHGATHEREVFFDFLAEPSKEYFFRTKFKYDRMYFFEFDPEFEDDDRLAKAIDDGKFKKAKKLIEQRRGLMYRGPNGNALSSAARVGQLELIELLLLSGVDPSGQDQFGQSALAIAASQECTECLVALIESGAEINWVSNFGTALHIATRNDNQSRMELLIAAGAGIDSRSNDGATPLHLAAGSGCVQCLRTLIRAGANVDAQRHDGRSPMHVAVESNHKAILRELLLEGGNVSLIDEQGNTPLHFAAVSDELDMVRQLIVAGADPNRPNELGYSPFLAAVAAGRPEIIGDLTNENLNIEREVDGDTALILAARRGSENLIRHSIASGADVNRGDRDGFGPIYYTARSGNLEGTQMLLAAGASIEYADPLDTPLNAASRNNHAAVAKALILAGAVPVERNRYQEDIFATGVSSLFYAEHISSSKPARSAKYYQLAVEKLTIAEESFRATSREAGKRYRSKTFWDTVLVAVVAAAATEAQRIRTAPQRQLLGEALALQGAQTTSEYFARNESFQTALGVGETVLPGSVGIKDIDSPTQRDDLLVAQGEYRAKANLAAKYLAIAASALQN